MSESVLLNMIFREVIIPNVCGLVAHFDDSSVVASDPSGSEIAPGTYAFKKLSGINWNSEFKGPIGNDLRPGMRESSLKALTKTVISCLHLMSIENVPLTLLDASSIYSATEAQAVYVGSLTLTWIETAYLFGKFKLGSKLITSTLVLDSLTLSCRLIGHNQFLSCNGNSAPEVGGNLICGQLEGTLSIPMAGRYSSAAIECKSNSLLPPDNPTTYQYETRQAKIIIF